jgi:ATP-dependent DNA helicase DinG
VIEKLIEASRGRALVLFTSYRNLNFVAENVETQYPFKSQGDMPPAKLIKWFKDTPDSVLFATATFWQGIDIKGDDLSLVVIVRLPFSSPGDPVYQERCNRLKGRWFYDLALPHATLSLRQGFGRLIRGRDECGVVAILDTRLVKNSYGRYIISSLPPADITHDIRDVEAFFDSHQGSR